MLLRFSDDGSDVEDRVVFDVLWSIKVLVERANVIRKREAGQLACLYIKARSTCSRLSRHLLQGSHGMPRGLVIAITRLDHCPFLMRIKLAIFSPGAENVNLWGLLLDVVQTSGCDDSYDALGLEIVISWSESNN